MNVNLEITVSNKKFILASGKFLIHIRLGKSLKQGNKKER